MKEITPNQPTANDLAVMRNGFEDLLARAAINPQAILTSLQSPEQPATPLVVETNCWTSSKLEAQMTRPQRVMRWMLEHIVYIGT